MRQFAASGFRIWNLSREAKVIYTCFCALSLAAIASSLLLYEDIVGPTLHRAHTARVRAYYTESATLDTAEATPAAMGSDPGRRDKGPAIALPAEAETLETAKPPERRLTVTVPYRKLLEVTHFHLFTVPVFLLILTHLFLLTGMAPRWKLFWISGGFAMGTLHIFAPWIVRYGGASLVTVFPLSGAGFFVTTMVLCIYPMVVMWKPRRTEKRPFAPPVPAEY